MNKNSFDIKKRRLELGLTLEDVASEVGVGKSTVRKWETGDIKNMRRDNMASLALALNIDPLLLIFDDQETESGNLYGDHDKIISHLNEKPELLEIYKEIYESESLQLLFDSARDLSPEDLEAVLKVVQRLKRD